MDKLLKILGAVVLVLLVVSLATKLKKILILAAVLMAVCVVISFWQKGRQK